MFKKYMSHFCAQCPEGVLPLKVQANVQPHPAPKTPMLADLRGDYKVVSIFPFTKFSTPGLLQGGKLLELAGFGQWC
jgi:hypothetical protein